MKVLEVKIHVIELGVLERAAGQPGAVPGGSAQIGRCEIDVFVSIHLSLKDGTQRSFAHIRRAEADFAKAGAPDAQILEASSVEYAVLDLAIHEANMGQARGRKIERTPRDPSYVCRSREYIEMAHRQSYLAGDLCSGQTQIAQIEPAADQADAEAIKGFPVTEAVPNLDAHIIALRSQVRALAGALIQLENYTPQQSPSGAAWTIYHAEVVPVQGDEAPRDLVADDRVRAV